MSNRCLQSELFQITSGPVKIRKRPKSILYDLTSLTDKEYQTTRRRNEKFKLKEKLMW